VGQSRALKPGETHNVLPRERHAARAQSAHSLLRHDPLEPELVEVAQKVVHAPRLGRDDEALHEVGGEGRADEPLERGVGRGHFGKVTSYRKR